MVNGGGKRMRLGEMLVSEGLINDAQLKRALMEQKQWGGKLGQVLLNMRFITEDDLAHALQNKLGVKWISLREIKIPPTIIQRVPAEMAKTLMIVPVGERKKTLFVATTDPTDIKTVDTLSFKLNEPVKPLIATESDIRWAIAKYYDATFPQSQFSEEDFQPLFDGGDNARDGVVLSEDDLRKKTPSTALDAAPPAPKPQRKAQQSLPIGQEPIEVRFEALLRVLEEKGFLVQQELVNMVQQMNREKEGL